MMTEIHHVVDGTRSEDPAETHAPSTTGPLATPVRRTDLESTTRSPFALTDKGQEIERSLGVDR